MTSEKNNYKRRPLVGIRTDEHTQLELGESTMQEFQVSYFNEPLQTTWLSLMLEDGNGYAKFFTFDSPAQAVAFFKCCLAQAERYLP